MFYFSLNDVIIINELINDERGCIRMFITDLENVLESVEEDIVNANVISKDNCLLIETFNGILKNKRHHCRRSFEKEKDFFVDLKRDFFDFSSKLSVREGSFKSGDFINKIPMVMMIESLENQHNELCFNGGTVSVSVLMYCETIRAMLKVLGKRQPKLSTYYRKLIDGVYNFEYEDMSEIKISSVIIKMINKIDRRLDDVLCEIDRTNHKFADKKDDVDLFASIYQCSKEIDYKLKLLINKRFYDYSDAFVMMNVINQSGIPEKEIARQSEVDYNLVIRIKKLYNDGGDLTIRDKTFDDYQKLISTLIKINRDYLIKTKEMLKISDTKFKKIKERYGENDDL